MTELPAPLSGLKDVPDAEARRRVLAFVLEQLADFLQLDGPDDLDPRTTFLDLGFDSLRAVDFKDLLAAALGCELRTTLAFDYPTPAAVADHLAQDVLEVVAPPRASVNVPADDLEDPPDLDTLSPEELRALLTERTERLRALRDRLHEPIAVVAVGCRFPGGADDPESFWRLQRDAVDAITEIPPERFPIDPLYDPDPSTPGKIATRYGGFLDDIDLFDARFFGMSAREATELDPRQRLLLETTWEALEHGGQSPDALRGTPVGVFLGILSHEYFDSQTDRNPEQVGSYAATGSALSTAAGRISYTLGWTGPAIALDTACSSSLVALHLAVQSIRRGECEAALAGGVNLLLDEISTISISQASMLAPDGRCKTFDASGDGYVRSEGVGVALLKPLSKALADGDRVFAVVRGTASNQDGASSGLTVPNGPSQERVLRAALADGRVDPADVTYIEAHGTGTSLGDPIEVAALDAVFGPDRPADRPLWCGSVKTNIGHSEPSAGIAGFIKLVLALEHGELPPSLHFHEPNPHIPWDRSIVRVPTERVPWPRGDRPRICGVSSFGFSGTNAHVVVEEAPLPAPARESGPAPGEPGPALLALSAHDDAALQRRLEDLRDHVAPDRAGRSGHPEGPPPDWRDVCHTAAVGRAHHTRRIALVVSGQEELHASLRDAARDPEHGVRGSAGPQAPRVAFLFTGQGSQYAGMGSELYASEPVFRSTLNRCAEILAPLLEQPLLSVLWGEDTELLDETRYTQPALFALEYSLAATWRAWGIEPACVLGHSVGEYVAACVAGIFSLEDGLALIAARGRLMTELTEPGAMLVAFASEDDVAPQAARFPGKVDVAAVNGPSITVLSGATDAIDAIERDLGARGVTAQRLTVSHAFHSPLMEPMLDAFREVASGVEFREPSIPLVSCLTNGAAMTSAEEWVRHVRAAVRFRDGMESLAAAETPCDVLLEIGPSPVLLGMARRFLRTKETTWLPSLRQGQGEGTALLTSLAELYARGADVTWSAVSPRAADRRLVELPCYPFQRERFWYERRLSRPGVAEGGVGGAWHPLLGRRLPAAVLADDQSLFQSAVAEDAPGYLRDHRVFETVIVPGAAYLEIGLAAGASELHTGRLRLEGVAIREPLSVGADSTAIQTVLVPTSNEGGGFEFRIHGLVPPRDESETESWVLHASGRVRAETSDDPELLPTKPLDMLRVGAWEDRSVDEYYAAYDDAGLRYGPNFRALRELKRRRGEVLARVRLADELAESEEYHLHPVLLDACFQTAAAAIFESEIEDIYLPVGLDVVRCLRRPEGDVWVHATLRGAGESGARSLGIDLVLFEASSGEPVAAVEGLQLVLADRSTMARADDALRGVVHEVAWRPGPLVDDEGEPVETGGFLIVSGPTRLANALASELETRGHRTTRAEPGDAADSALEWLAPLRGALHLASLEDGDLERSLGSALDLAQALGRRESSAGRAQVALVTRGAQQTGEDGELRPEGATLWGLGNTLALEHPELACLRLDLDPRGGDAEIEARFLADELCRPDGEDRVALRGDERLVARLARMGVGDASGGAAALVPPPTEAWHLRTPAYGVLENLRLQPLERRAPGPDEVELEVRAAGLNFKDVLHTLGMLREFSEAQGILEAKDQPLGFECAGTVVRVGANVTRLAPGDEVLASTTTGCFATHVTAPAAAVFKQPAGLSATDAAAVQTVFLTAIYGLERCARLQEGERVLIHACAGGVGQAALQLAQARGCEVFATASRGKHEFLRSQGVQHVLDSRTLAFSDEVLRLTDGQGVDVVLNSLAGDYVEASLRCLGQGGRFVEIGKLDTWEPGRMAQERPDVTYFRFDLSETSEEDPHRPRVTIQELQAEMAAGFHEGALHALPVRVFPVESAVDAFRHLAQAKNIGKVVLAFPRAARAGAEDADAAGEAEGTAERIRADRSVLVTGGLGALGLVVARRLVEAGARSLFLAGRRGLEGAGDGVQRELESLREAGASVDVAALDVADRDAVAVLIDRIDRGPAPLGGIVHAAGVLDDGMLVNQDWGRFRAVLAPKVEGTRHLHELTADRELDFFVLFSSMAALLGSPGQSSYAAGNAYMDTLAEARRARGLHALSVNWGPWSGGGMATSLASRNQVRFAEMGLRSLSPERGGEIFEHLLRTRDGHVAVLPIQWSKYLRRQGAGGAPPFFEQFAVTRTDEETGASSVLQDLERAAPEDRLQVLSEFVERQLAKVLGFGASTSIDRDRTFGDLGVDSLLAVDLRNRLEVSLSVALPATLLFDHPSFHLLVKELALRVLPSLASGDGAPGSGADGAGAPEPSAERERLMAELEDLSDDEIAARLAAQIEAMSDGRERG